MSAYPFLGNSNSADRHPSLTRGRVRAEVIPAGEREHLVMRVPPVVHVLPIEVDGDIVLVRQLRPALGHRILEAPAGGIDAGETPEVAAARELAEETGLGARWLEYLGGFSTCPGVMDEVAHMFIGHGCRPLADPPAGDEDEQIELVRLTPQFSLSDLASDGVVDAKTALLIALAGAGMRAT